MWVNKTPGKQRTGPKRKHSGWSDKLSNTEQIRLFLSVPAVGVICRGAIPIITCLPALSFELLLIKPHWTQFYIYNLIKLELFKGQPGCKDGLSLWTDLEAWWVHTAVQTLIPSRHMYLNWHYKLSSCVTRCTCTRTAARRLQRRASNSRTAPLRASVWAEPRRVLKTLRSLQQTKVKLSHYNWSDSSSPGPGVKQLRLNKHPQTKRGATFLTKEE